MPLSPLKTLWVGALLGGLAWASGVEVAYPDAPLGVPLGGSFCFWGQDGWGFWGQEAWEEDMEALDPLCLPAPKRNAILRLELPGGRAYQLRVRPLYEGGTSGPFLLIFGEQDGFPRERPQGSVRSFYLYDESEYYQPFPGALTDLPGLKGWIRRGEDDPSQILFRFYGPPLRWGRLVGVALYRDGLEQKVKSVVLESATDRGETEVYGGISFSPAPGVYELRFFFAADDGEELGRVLYRFGVSRRSSP